MGLFIFIVVLLFGVIAGVAGKNTDNSGASEWYCPHGYDEYACNTACPLHHHCAGSGEEAFIPHIDPNSSKYDYDSLPTGGNEDGDWRMVYMDDTLYDEREEDELYDDDRDINGGW